MELRPGYKQAEIGVIPEEWDVKPLADVLEKARLGGNYPNQDAESDFPLMKMGNVARGVFDLSSVEYISRAASPEAQHRLAMGDVIFNTRNTLDLVGKVAIWRGGLPVAYYNSNLLRLEFNASEIASSDYANYWLNTATAVSRLRALATGTTSVAAIYTRDLLRFSIAVPPLPEQSAIAAALGDVDALLAAQDALIAKKRAIKQGAMQELLTGKRRLPGFSGEWEMKSLGELAQLSKAGINPSATPEALFTHFSLPAFDAFETPVVEVGASIGSNKFVVPQGAVLLSKLNPRIPRTWAPKEVPSNSVCSTEFMVLIPNESVDKEFLMLACRSNHVIAQMELHAIGTTGSHQRIHPRQALKIEISIPTDQEEQSKISKALSDMAVEVTALEAQRAKTVQLKQGMMQALLTGRIRLV
ncbi:restriction endonuclease subunit S [Stenotrophomonas maltophilia]|uniref:restriction endonuclease subunit S n=1 Tax=Stenotrophomonas maltophilia TaxID=40324 RepID=UPI0015DD7712|nr:restriction endonuclease subunit S [Stenotrophomonas maltophilia]